MNPKRKHTQMHKLFCLSSLLLENLDELKPTDKGGKIKSWDCGIFCDTE